MAEEEEDRQEEEVRLEEVERFQKSIRVEGDVADFNCNCIKIWRMLLLVFFLIKTKIKLGKQTKSSMLIILPTLMIIIHSCK